MAAKRRRLLPVLLGLGVVVLGEAGLAVLGFFPNPVDQVEHDQGGDGTLRIHLTGPFHRHTIDLSASPEPGVERIVVAGGSTVYGPRLYPRSTIPRFLELLVEERLGSACESVNMGVPGISIERVRAFVEFALENLAPDLVVVYSGHNEFLGPRRLAFIERVESPRHSRLAGLVRSTRIGRALARVVSLKGERGGRREASAQLEIMESSRLAPARESVYAHYQEELERIVSSCAQRGVSLVFVTPVSNKIEYGPLVSAFSRPLQAQDRERFEDLLQEAVQALDAKDFERLDILLQSAAAIDPDVSELVHLSARRAWSRGDVQLARELDTRKWDLDEFPIEASGGILARLERVATATGTPLVDLREDFERPLEPGEQALFLDYVHPTVYGQYRIAREIAPVAADLLGHTGAETTPTSFTFDEARQRLALDDSFLENANRLDLMGLLNQACFARWPTPYLQRARGVLQGMTESAIVGSPALMADIVLAIFDRNRERVLARARVAHPEMLAVLLSRLGRIRRIQEALEGMRIEIRDGALVAL